MTARDLVLLALALAPAATCAPATRARPAGGAVEPAGGPLAASYTVVVHSVAPVPRFTVRAELRGIGDTLRMATTRPGDSPQLLRLGWPALVSNLRVHTAEGDPVAATGAGAAGWVLGPHGPIVRVEYEVDFRLLAGQGWPAPREAAHLDDRALLVVARSLFVGGVAAAPATVAFVLPPGWRVAAPWPPEPGTDRSFRVRSFEQLTTNLFALTRTRPRVVSVQGFALESVPFGAWANRDAEILEVLRASAVSYTRLFGRDRPHRYVAAFLEGDEMAGEAYLDSYAMQSDPRLERGVWARIVAHELFHYWNGQRLRGADYTASQWFQEGVTEYYALLATVRNGFIDEPELLRRLSGALAASRGMAASLVESGNRKNAAFYGRATLTAFLLDLLLRERTGGGRSLDDLLRATWRDFGSVDRPYSLADVYSAASAVAGASAGEWLAAQVGTAAPPDPGALLATAGLRVGTDSAGVEHIRVDPTSPPRARARWRSIISPN